MNKTSSKESLVVTSTDEKPLHKALILRITTTLPNVLPGYDGDARVYWETSQVDNQQEAIEITLSGLKILRDFWIGTSSEKDMQPIEHLQILGGVTFTTFFRTICGDLTSSSTCRLEAVSNAELSQFATLLVENPHLIPSFLTDLRDWDAFRLLMRRRSVELCVLPWSCAKGRVMDETKQRVKQSSDGYDSDVSEQDKQSMDESRDYDALAKRFEDASQRWKSERSLLLSSLNSCRQRLNNIMSIICEEEMTVKDKKSILKWKDHLSSDEEIKSNSKKSVRWHQAVLMAEEEKENQLRVSARLYLLQQSFMEGNNEEASDSLAGDFPFAQESGVCSNSEEDPTDEELDNFSNLLREVKSSPRIVMKHENEDLKTVQISCFSPAAERLRVRVPDEHIVKGKTSSPPVLIFSGRKNRKERWKQSKDSLTPDSDLTLDSDQTELQSPHQVQTPLNSTEIIQEPHKPGSLQPNSSDTLLESHAKPSKSLSNWIKKTSSISDLKRHLSFKRNSFSQVSEPLVSEDKEKNIKRRWSFIRK